MGTKSISMILPFPVGEVGVFNALHHRHPDREAFPEPTPGGVLGHPLPYSNARAVFPPIECPETRQHGVLEDTPEYGSTWDYGDTFGEATSADADWRTRAFRSELALRF